jgi:hypothetical protein
VPLSTPTAFADLAATLDDPSLPMREKALALAEIGFRVFRLTPNSKMPLKNVSWTAEATTDPIVIDALWGEQPYNIGIACGGPNGTLAVDLDVKEGKQGVAHWSDLVATMGAPDTLTVETPSGGRHLIYRVDPSELEHLANSVSHVAPGVDIRADRGFIVAAGSVIPGVGTYRVLAAKPPAEAPPWLLTRARKSGATLAAVSGPVKPDTNEAIHQAIQWLYSEAPAAVEGDGGDATTFKVAAKLKDMGVSPRRAFDLLTHHWNERCDPPWPLDELQRKVANAFRYGANPFGADTAEAQLPADVPGAEPDAKPARSALAVFTEPDAAGMRAQMRPWIVPGVAMEGVVTLLVAPGGAGKSTWTFSLANAVARCEGGFVGYDVVEKRAGAVWMVNNEDSRNELLLRQMAFRKHWSLDRPSRHPILFSSGQERPFRVTQQVKLPSGALVQRPVDVDAAVDLMRERGVKLMIVDPFVETHDADENDNAAMAAVAAAYREIAQRAEAAVVLVHHTRKNGVASEGHAGSADSARGAGSVVNVARIVFTLYAMSAKEAKELNVPESERRRWVRLDTAKANLSSTEGGPRWYKLSSTTVPAVDPRDNEIGEEHVAVLTPAEPRTPGADEALLLQVRDAMGAEMRMLQSRVVNTLVAEGFYKQAEAARLAVARLFPGGEPRDFDQETFLRERDAGGRNWWIVRRPSSQFSDLSDL